MKQSYIEENGNMKLAIIILNYNTWELTAQFITKQLKKLNLPLNTTIVVIDNASTNNSAIELQRLSKQLNYVFLKSEKNGGYAAGNNIALRWAYEHGYDYGWVTNTDIEFDDSETIKNMLNIFAKDSRIAVVSPRVYTPSGMETNRNLYRPSVFDLTFGKMRFRRMGRTVPPSLKGIDDTYCYNYRSQGCCMAIDLKILNAIDYMDENTFLYMEEPILAEKLLLKGYREACALNSKVVHNHSTTVGSVAKRRQIFRWQNESANYYYRKYRHFNKLEIAMCTVFSWLYCRIVLKFRKFN